MSPAGRLRQAGMVKMAHQSALTPTATRRDEVVPPMSVTGTMSSARTDTPDKKPRAVPIEDMREVVSESSEL